MQVSFRQARPEDVEAAIPLIYSSGPEALDYVFGNRKMNAQKFLGLAFGDGRGFFGWRNHVVAMLDGEVVGIGAFYSGHEYQRLSRQTIFQILRFYPLLSVPGIIRRALQLKTLMPPPSRSTQYIANLGVRPETRSHGVGASLIRYQQQAAIRLNRTTYALDVSVANPRGQALYERLGFAVTSHQCFHGPTGLLPNTRRMEIKIGV